MPERRVDIHVRYGELPSSQRHWWLLVDPEAGVDLCSVDPGFDVDLYLTTDLRTMTEIWMGYSSFAKAQDSGRLTVTGSPQLRSDLQVWLKLSRFAKVHRMVA